MNDAQLQRLAEIAQHSPACLGTTRKAFSGKSKAAALKAKCLDCACWQRAEVKHCSALACPLWPYRPFQGREDAPEHPALP